MRRNLETRFEMLDRFETEDYKADLFITTGLRMGVQHIDSEIKRETFDAIYSTRMDFIRSLEKHENSRLEWILKELVFADMLRTLAIMHSKYVQVGENMTTEQYSGTLLLLADQTEERVWKIDRSYD